MKAPILDRIGSDPEFIPGSFSEFDFAVIPANKLISNNRAVSLRSFIGTDGHNAIGELRPRPCHNIRQHLYDIAAGIVAIADYLPTRKDLKNVAIYANPELGGETLAGHIHFSFFVDEPLTVKALELGRIQGMLGDLVNGYEVGLNVPPPPPPSPLAVPILAEYARAAASLELVTPGVMATAMGHFLKPLEWWVQPWHSRKRRNRHYGLGVDEIRWSQSGRNPGFRRECLNHAWLHYEYRMPSTWLVHPWLAYTYLALVKTVMTNWQLVQRLLVPDATEFQWASNTPLNAEASKLFLDRWDLFKKEGGRITRDASHIDRALSICAENREDWFSNLGRVRVEAWRGLL